MPHRHTALAAAVLLLTLPLNLPLGVSIPPAAAQAPGAWDFEAGGPGSRPDQWNGGPTATLAADTAVVHGGRMSGRITRSADSPEAFSALSFGLDADRDGQTIELRGWLKSEDVEGWFGLWFRQDGPDGTVGFDNMQARGLTGTTAWTEHRIVLPLSPEARGLRVGALLGGTGTVWVDDLSLWIDGRPLAAAPRAAHTITVLETDTTFVAGSGIELSGTSDLQADNLALLGRVWGFLKYHHPAATTGRRHWDFELFRVMPPVLAAPDRAAARQALVAWIDGLGSLAPCDPCAEAPIDPAQPADLAWLADQELLGADLAARLQAVHAARPADGDQFYVGAHPNVGNPVFDHEPAYDRLEQVDAGYRLLALFRFWNIVQYCSPNRDIIGADWSGVLREFVPRLAGAGDHDAYRLEMLALVARLNDGHALLGGAWDMRPPGREGRLPVSVRRIEDQPVVAGYSHPVLGPATGLEIGDVVLAVDGRPAGELMDAWAPYYSASNEPVRRAQLASALPLGPLGECRLEIRRGDRTLALATRRVDLDSLDLAINRFHTLRGPGFRILDPGVAYMALEQIRRDSVRTWIEAALAADAAGLVIDCRAYPSDFPIFELGGHLVARDTRFVTFTRLDRANPGAFLWDDYRPLAPRPPHFGRPVVVLVDEVSLSSAEYHALAFGAAPQAVVMGSTTAGADGNVSRFALPGGLSTMISGIGIYDADRNNTQRTGIVPDIEVKPTIAGLRAGRDEVLEAAVAHILGREATTAGRGAR
ncbi:MAG: S41 family peptidase [Candidatus Krumholzibacteriia bacterium]